MSRKKRKHGTGTLRLRVDGRWEGRMIVDYDTAGKPKFKYVTAKSKRECAEKLSKIQKLTHTSQMGKNMMFGDWLHYWYQTFCKPRLRLTTQDNYENRIYKHIIPEIGMIPLGKVEITDLQLFYGQLKNNGRLIRIEQFGTGLSNQMVRGCHAHCKVALQRAVEEGLIYRNPAIGCKLPPKRKLPWDVPSLAELQRFIIQAQYDGYGALFLLELGTGLRLGELLALQWKDLSFKTGELQIWKQMVMICGKQELTEPKTKASIRTIILPEVLLNVLKQHKRDSRSRWLFPSPVIEDRPLTHGYVRRRLKTTLERAKCRQVRFHDLRHVFATMALENGMDAKTLSMLIGHVSVDTTLDVYSHVTNTMQKQAAMLIDRKFAGADMLESKDGQKPALQCEFVPYQSKYRKPGTGCITQINDHLWEGRYSPRVNGKRISKNVYAKSKEECEVKLKSLIKKMKSEICRNQ